MTHSIALIVACSDNNVIGKDNTLPWHLPEDLRYFKRRTLNKPIIMGKNTWLSLPKALPNRLNIVLSSNTAFKADGAVIAQTIDDALKIASQSLEETLAESSTSEFTPEIMIIGGGSIYRQTLAIADTVYLTRIHKTIEGDVFFDVLDPNIWQLVSSEPQPASIHNDTALNYSFEMYQRQSAEHPAPTSPSNAL